MYRVVDTCDDREHCSWEQNDSNRVHEVKTKKRAYLIFKADFEKTCDTVRWSFLAYMLYRMGFCSKWIGWMWGFLQSSFIFVLMNGGPTKEFIAKRGL